MGNPSQADRSRELSELHSLALEVQSANDLQRVKEIFYRVQEILQARPNDAEIQNTGADLKQLVLLKGKRIQEAQAAGIAPPPPPPPGPGTYVVDPAHDSGQRVAAPPPSLPPPPPPPMATAAMTPPPPVTQPPFLPPPPAGQTNGTFAIPVGPPPQPPPAPPKKGGWLGPVLGGAALAIAVFAGFLFVTNRKQEVPKKPDIPVTVAKGFLSIQTTPSGASVRVNGVARGASNTKIEDVPGLYDIEASLEGYEAVKSSARIEAGKTVNVALSLTPSGQTVQLNTDLDAGTVTLDQNPPKDLQGGTATLEHVPAGDHKLLVKGPKGDAAFNFTVAANGLADVKQPIKTRNLLAILLSTNGAQAKLQSSAPKLVKVTLDGQDKGMVTPQGVALDGVPAGDHELNWLESPTPIKLQLHFTPAPSLTAYLKLDVNAGTLIVVTGEEKAKVFIDGKELRVGTPKNGQLRIPGMAVKAYAIRVAKDGYQAEPEQQVKIKKGEETKVEFHLKPQPKLAVLQIKGAKPGATVLFDGESLGTVMPDGTFTASNVNPGEHNLELKLDRFQPVRLKKRFDAGKTVEIAANEVVMQPVLGKVTLTVSPANSTITMQGPGENQPHVVRDTTLPGLAEGSYVFSAEAPGHKKKSVTVQVASGQNKTVDLSLTPEKAAGPAAAGMGDWLEPQGWTKSGDMMVKKGGDFVLYRITPLNGTFTFTASLIKAGGVLKQRPLQWVLNYENPKSYLLFQMDKKFFYRKIVINGETKQLSKVPHGLDGDGPYTIRIDVTPESIVHRVKNGGFQEIDTHNDSSGVLGKGRFGFLIKKDDEVGLSNFSYQPK